MLFLSIFVYCCRYIIYCKCSGNYQWLSRRRTNAIPFQNTFTTG